jgi:hypothetical protein
VRRLRLGRARSEALQPDPQLAAAVGDAMMERQPTGASKGHRPLLADRAVATGPQRGRDPCASRRPGGQVRGTRGALCGARTSARSRRRSSTSGNRPSCSWNTSSTAPTRLANSTRSDSGGRAVHETPLDGTARPGYGTGPWALVAPRMTGSTRTTSMTVVTIAGVRAVLDDHSRITSPCRAALAPARRGSRPDPSAS